MGSPPRNRAGGRWGGVSASSSSKLSWGAKKGRAGNNSHHSTAKFSFYSTVYLCTSCALLGYLVGFLHCRILILQDTAGINSFDVAPVMLSTTGDDRKAPSLNVWQGTEFHQGSDGWKSVHVHYGTRKHLIDSPTAIHKDIDTTTANDNNKNTTTTMWYSQARQDEIVAALLRHKKSGYFVDLAANDATHWSNTYALERSLDWNGLCIEPNPIYWKNLSYRTCTVVGAVVGGAQRQEDVYFRYEAGTHGGIADEGFDNNRRWQKSSQHESMVPLLEVFQKAQVPRVIDYLSLDVEGAETLILTNFPLKEYRIHIITAERLKGPIRVYLKEHGYEFIKVGWMTAIVSRTSESGFSFRIQLMILLLIRISPSRLQKVTRWGESLWVHSESIPHLNMKALDAISFPVV